jgi:hypothetical protein
MITNFHAKYFAHDLTRRAAAGVDRLSMSLFDAAVDLNPHQTEAALIDEHLFGDVNSFRSQYTSAGSSLDALRQRLSTFCKRTLRNQVTEYIRYTERLPLTRPFTPTDDEHALYEAVSAFLQRENSYTLPQRQRHLTALILRKLLASSSEAIIQLFGRGVRLKGYNVSLKRSGKTQVPEDVERPRHITAMETLNIFGIRADYMAEFRQHLEEEGLPSKGSRYRRLPWTCGRPS